MWQNLRSTCEDGEGFVGALPGSGAPLTPGLPVWAVPATLSIWGHLTASFPPHTHHRWLTTIWLPRSPHPPTTPRVPVEALGEALEQPMAAVISVGYLLVDRPSLSLTGSYHQFINC